MPRNGTGAYNLPAGINPVLTQTLITSNWANTTMNDLALAITNSLAKDGQTVPTANLPMGNFRHTGVGDPTLRNNYASLGYVQDGKDKRLTGVVGVNQITATLPGGATGSVVGQIIQLIPTSNNTGAVTLNINSTGFFPVVTDVGNPLAAGNLVAGRPYLLSFNGAQWFVISAAGGVSGFAQSAMSGWDRPSISGPYPAITLVNPTTVFVPAGAGRIVRPSARDLSGVTEVTWPGQNVTITNVAVAWATVLGVNSAGAIVQFTGTFSPAWARENILLGSVAHINGQINEINTIPAIYGDMTYAAYDTALLLNNTLVSGGKVLPNAASPFHVDLQAGIIFSLGADSTDVNGPNTANFAAAFDLSFFPVTGNNTVGASTQNVPVTQYDPLGAGAVTPIPGGASTTTIHRLFLLAGEAVFLYGQSTYADLDTALSQIGVDDASVIYPSRLVNATLLAYIIAQKNCTDLKNVAQARIVAKGSANFNIGTAGSIAEAPINGLTYGRKDATWVQAVPAPVGAQATLRQVYYYTNTLARFSEGLNDTPEGGANSGSDWVLRRYNDVGTLLGTVMEVFRSTGSVDFHTPAFSIDGIQYNSPPNGAGYPGFNVYQDGKYSNPFTSGNAGGIGITALDTAVDAGCSITFRGQDSPTTERPGAVIAFGKDGAWAPLGGDYPGFLSFLTRSTAAGGGQTLERMRINSAGLVTIPGALTVTGAFTTAGPLVGNGIFAANPAASIQLRPNGAGSNVGELTVSTGGTVTMNSSSGQFLHQTSAGSNSTSHVFNNVTTGELGRIIGTANTLTFQTGAAAATRLTLSNVNATFTVPIITSSSVTSGQDFISSTATAVLAPTGAGNIHLRPNGAGSVVGQLLLAASGNATFNGTVTTIQNYASSTAVAVLGATGAGAVYLRPNGVGSSVGEFVVGSTGNVIAAGPGNMQVGSTIRSLGQNDATTGTGVDMYWTGSAGTVIAINRVGNVQQPIQFIGSTLNLRCEANVIVACSATGLGFFGTAATAKQTITGAKGGNVALTNLLVALAAIGLITNSTT